MGVIFLGSYLCISILEFKLNIQKQVKVNVEIYVFLYQNLNEDLQELSAQLTKFMYFYIRI